MADLKRCHTGVQTATAANPQKKWQKNRSAGAISATVVADAPETESVVESVVGASVGEPVGCGVGASVGASVGISVVGLPVVGAYVLPAGRGVGELVGRGVVGEPV